MCVCVFSQAVVLEGKYQKRKVEAVAREYRKWRMFHREKFVKYFKNNTLTYLSHSVFVVFLRDKEGVRQILCWLIL